MISESTFAELRIISKTRNTRSVSADISIDYQFSSVTLFNSRRLENLFLIASLGRAFKRNSFGNERKTFLYLVIPKEDEKLVEKRK